MGPYSHKALDVSAPSPCVWGVPHMKQRSQQACVPTGETIRETIIKKCRVLVNVQGVRDILIINSCMPDLSVGGYECNFIRNEKHNILTSPIHTWKLIRKTRCTFFPGFSSTTPTLKIVLSPCAFINVKCRFDNAKPFLEFKNHISTYC